MAREPQDWKVVEHSTDHARTWAEIEPEPRSPLVAELGRLREFEVHDGGSGNLYRWRTRT